MAGHDGAMPSKRTAWLVTTVALLVAVATSWAVVASYRRGYDTEVNTDDLERVLNGMFVALPWIALLAAELLTVVLVGLWRATRQPAATASGASTREN